MQDFSNNSEDEDSKNLMNALISKLNNIKVRSPTESKLLRNGK